MNPLNNNNANNGNNNSNNPVLQVIKMLNGRNPQQVFYEMCKERGVNPEDILKHLR